MVLFRKALLLSSNEARDHWTTINSESKYADLWLGIPIKLNKKYTWGGL